MVQRRQYISTKDRWRLVVIGLVMCAILGGLITLLALAPPEAVCEHFEKLHPNSAGVEALPHGICKNRERHRRMAKNHR